ncbi:MAG: DUF1492 domain-containing protein [Clostridia bacterium]
MSKFCDVKKEAEDLYNRIERLTKQTDIISDTVQNGVTGHRKNILSITGIDLKRAYKLELYKNKLKNKYDELLELQNEVEDFIEKIEDSQTRQIMRYRYMDSKSWIQIMHKMNYSAESTARMIHDRFLNKK